MSVALASQNANALAHIDPKHVIQLYLADQRTVDIAQALGVTRSGLNQWLLRNVEADWKEAQVARAITRKEKAEEEMEAAADALSLARARELLKAAQWDLERVCRRIYGQDAPPPGVSVVIQLGSDLRALQQKHDISTDQSQVIDVETLPADSESVGVVKGVGEVRK